MSTPSDSICVLHVDDEPDIAQLTARFLNHVDERINVEIARSTQEALQRLKEGSFDCILSDYDMPAQNGIEFLRSVRSRNPTLPFILYTGVGSEEIASTAISAGVTEYLQKDQGTDHYQVLANRIKIAVSKYRAERKVDAIKRRYRRLIQETTDVIVIVDTRGKFDYLSPSAHDVLGYSPDELLGRNGFDYIHPDDRKEAQDLFAEMVVDPELRPTIEFRFRQKDGSWVWLEARGRNLLDDPTIEGIVVYARDITERFQYEHRLRRQSERLEKFIEIVSQDLQQSITNLAEAIEVAEQTEDSPYVSQCRVALERIDSLSDYLLTVADGKEEIEERELIDLGQVIEQCWEKIGLRRSKLRINTDQEILANKNELNNLIEDILLRAVQAGQRDMTVTVGELETGFYVEYRCVATPINEHQLAGNSESSTTKGEIDFSLDIASAIAETHGWNVCEMEVEEGRIRVEVTGAELSNG